MESAAVATGLTPNGDSRGHKSGCETGLSPTSSSLSRLPEDRPGGGDLGDRERFIPTAILSGRFLYPENRRGEPGGVIMYWVGWDVGVDVAVASRTGADISPTEEPKALDEVLSAG